MLQYFRTPPQHRRKAIVMWIFSAAMIVFLVMFLLLYAGIGAQAASVPGTDAAERWRAEDSIYPYAQLAAYFDDSASISLNDVYLARMEMTKALEENAITTPEGASAFIDAFSGETTVSVSTERAVVSTAAVVCGGDFFFFHPIDLIDGGYFSEDDHTSNSVILDEYAAWQLFGATEVAGMEVTIGGQPYRVSGVSKSPEEDVEKYAYGEIPRIYVNYIGLRLTNGFDAGTCYEIVLPNPIDSFASNIVESQFGITDTTNSAVLYDYTERFDFEVLAGASPDYFLRAMQKTRVIPPYWENVARVAEGKAVVLAFFAAVFGILALICFVVFISFWFYMHPIRLRMIWNFFEDKLEARRMKRWLKKQNSPLNAPERKVHNET